MWCVALLDALMAARPWCSARCAARLAASVPLPERLTPVTPTTRSGWTMAARGRTAQSEVTLHASGSSGERIYRRQQPLTQISRRGHRSPRACGWRMAVWRGGGASKQAGRTVAVASAPNTGAAGKMPRSARTLQAIVRRAGPLQAAEAQQGACQGRPRASSKKA